jgi:hypothetical protein
MTENSSTLNSSLSPDYPPSIKHSRRKPHLRAKKAGSVTIASFVVVVLPTLDEIHARINLLANERLMLWAGRREQIIMAYPLAAGRDKLYSSRVEEIAMELHNLYVIKRTVLAKAGVDFLM